VVPPTASTGTVRLERDRSGITLQIVPRVSAFTPDGGSGFTLTGDGFAEGQTEVLFISAEMADYSRAYGPDTYNSSTRLAASGPVGVSRATLRVRTPGGTSAEFNTGQP
ncbi:hypothetical protein, partial [Aquabacterium sp. OR-4]|uniref:hypothetical protein n=1 Tax=Aquabacterium sp. OR-4 TaxID=2978127 RepID=UPI0028C600EF